uniref:Uncharacterized protein n=1 Tax=Schistosoma mansoni TaxID=6183 RepID=A0A913KVL2_SCHMA
MTKLNIKSYIVPILFFSIGATIILVVSILYIYYKMESVANARDDCC